MAGYNRVILLGNLTRDPQLRYLPNNMAVCDLGLAVSRKFRDRDGNQKEDTCFIDLVAWGRQAETINQYMSKGRPLLVEGRLQLDTWTGQDGQKHSKHRVVIENFQFVGGRPDQGGGGGAPYEQRSAPAERGPLNDRPVQSLDNARPPAGVPLPPEPEPPPPVGDEIPF